jgi:3-hydroxyisobutyrate dehydrogenase-like beta-hydroxyacid dehydrogenase
MSTPLRIALISPGSMGSAVGARLVDAGHEVLTSLTGRSAASRERAAAAGMGHAEDEALAACDIFVSIVPPGEAMALAERMLPHFAARDDKPLYIDGNAISPATVKAIAARLATAGCALVDGAILGGPPRRVTDPEAPVLTTLLLSGEESGRAAAALGSPALPARILDGGIGAASALKMCFGGITKGAAGLVTTLLLAAERHGAGEALRAELTHRHAKQYEGYHWQVRNMLPKAYRWVAEMEEISAFLGEHDPAGAELFSGMAALFQRLAVDQEGDGREVATLEQAVRLT